MKNKIILIIFILITSILLLQSPNDVAWGESTGQTVPTLGPSLTSTLITIPPTNSPTRTSTSTLHSTVTATSTPRSFMTSIPTNTAEFSATTLLVPSATPSPVITILESASTLTSSPLETKISKTQTSDLISSPQLTENVVTITIATKNIAKATSTIVKSEVIENKQSPPGWLLPLIGTALLISFIFILRSVFQKNNKKS
ncbi:MAG: hypothetical protein ACYDH1_00890 [Anaerolineaceae bacterium]